MCNFSNTKAVISLSATLSAELDSSNFIYHLEAPGFEISSRAEACISSRDKGIEKRLYFTTSAHTSITERSAILTDEYFFFVFGQHLVVLRVPEFEIECIRHGDIGGCFGIYRHSSQGREFIIVHGETALFACYPNGMERWRFEPRDIIVEAPKIAGETITIKNFADHTYVLDVVTGCESKDS
jgi:hypothetical protein